MNETLNNPSIKKIIPLDDVRAEFENKNDANSYEENGQVLSSSVGRINDESSLTELEETMYTLENSIVSIAPKVPVVPEKKLEKIKMVAREKLARKSVRDEMKDIKFNNNPELANLDNTIIINAEVLKQGLIHSEKKKDETKENKKSIMIIVILFVLLVLFALSIPFIINSL